MDGKQPITARREKISASAISRGLHTEFIGQNIFLYDSCPSTNLSAKQSLSASNGSVFISERQTSGRGRHGRNWCSEDSCGIYMSILLKPRLSPEALPAVTLVAGLSVSSALSKLCNMDFSIKWPNDIIFGTKKICGILSELAIDKTANIIVGIGINVTNTHFPAELSEKAGSVMTETGITLSRNEVISLVLNEFEKYYTVFLENGFSSLKDEYEKNCVTVGREVFIITPAEKYTAHTVGIAQDGSLLAERSGKVEKISSGEVSVRGIYGYV